MENTRKARTNRLKINCFFDVDFWLILSQLGWILGSKLGPNKYVSPTLFPSCVQESSKTCPRAPQARPKSAQECPKSAPRVPKSALRASLERPRGSQECPRVWEFRNMLRTGRSELQTFGRPKILDLDCNISKDFGGRLQAWSPPYLWGGPLSRYRAPVSAGSRVMGRPVFSRFSRLGFKMGFLMIWDRFLDDFDMIFDDL